ncbi:hypothetical protein C2S51_011836 [Perilla frutescens var. frutescens]|nr:hypothetical protein C2S51_011836 [Perilla frutescens var. frutescens]
MEEFSSDSNDGERTALWMTSCGQLPEGGEKVGDGAVNDGRLRASGYALVLRVQAARKWLHLGSMRVWASRWATVAAAHQGCASGACTLGLRVTIFSGDLSLQKSGNFKFKSASLQFFHLLPPEKVLESYRKNLVPLTIAECDKDFAELTGNHPQVADEFFACVAVGVNLILFFFSR